MEPVTSVKVMMVTSYPPKRPGEKVGWPDLAAITIPTHQRYAEKHGYSLYVDQSDISARMQSQWVDEQKSGYAPLRFMIKFRLLEHFLREEDCGEQYDWVVWVDADCLFTNYERPLTDWMNECSGDDSTYVGDVVLAKDVNGLHPTVIMVRNSLRTRGLIYACRDGGTRMWQLHSWSDIMALRFYLATEPYSHLPVYHWARELCAMPVGVYTTIPDDVRREHEWTPESLTLHLSALSLEERCKIAKQYLERLALV